MQITVPQFNYRNHSLKRIFSMSPPWYLFKENILNHSLDLSCCPLELFQKKSKLCSGLNAWSSNHFNNSMFEEVKTAVLMSMIQFMICVGLCFM
jgi:hypothetical protein